MHGHVKSEEIYHITQGQGLMFLGDEQKVSHFIDFTAMSDSVYRDTLRQLSPRRFLTSSNGILSLEAMEVSRA